MWYLVSENPWPIAGLLSVVALIFLILLRVTQDGRYLIRAAVTVGLILLLLVVERLWVTQNEQIEAVVYELGRAVAASDGPRVVALMAPQVAIGQHSRTDFVELDPAQLEATLNQIQFDWLRVTRVSAHAGSQTNLGTAEFRVNAAGSAASAMGVRLNFATGNSDWSIGLRKTSDGSWKITRINPLSIPRYAEPAVGSYLSRISRNGRGPDRPDGRPSFFEGRERRRLFVQPIRPE